MDYLTPYIGSTAAFVSRTWGPVTVECASFTPARDGDLVVTIGTPFQEDRPLVRIHSECVFAEAFDSSLCDCADQLRMALDAIRGNGSGIVFYLRFDGRGAGLAAKVAATALEVEGVDTFDSRVQIGVEPEGRDFGNVGQYLYRRGVRAVRLLTNSPVKIAGIADAGISVEAVPLYVSAPNASVRDLYRSKRERFGHKLPED